MKLAIIFMLAISFAYAQINCEVCVEDAASCPPECTAPASLPPTGYFCGNGKCDAGESCSSCSADCSCENTSIDANETDQIIATQDAPAPPQENVAAENEPLEPINDWPKKESNKKFLLFMSLIGLAAFIFAIFLVFRNKRNKIKGPKSELIGTLSINENLLSQLVAYIKRNLDKGYSAEIIKSSLIKAGHNPGTIEKIMENVKNKKI